MPTSAPSHSSRVPQRLPHDSPRRIAFLRFRSRDASGSVGFSFAAIARRVTAGSMGQGKERKAEKGFTAHALDVTQLSA